MPSVINKIGSHDTAIGTGLGIPLGLAVFSLIAFLLLRDRRYKKQLLDLQSDRSVAAGDGKDITQEMSSLDPTAPDQIYELGSKPEGKVVWDHSRWKAQSRLMNYLKGANDKLRWTDIG